MQTLPSAVRKRTTPPSCSVVGSLGRDKALARLWVGLLAGATLLYGQAKSRSGTTAVTVGEQDLLQLQGVNVILKIRLRPGVTASLWSDRACRAPIPRAMAITASGTYSISLTSIPQAEGPRAEDPQADERAAFVCLLSSERKLRDSILLPPRPHVTPLPPSLRRSAPQ